MADNALLYRAILDVFAASKRQFRLHLRPDDVLAEATWPGGPPTPETVQQALGQLVDWGNLQSQPEYCRKSPKCICGFVTITSRSGHRFQSHFETSSPRAIF